MKDVKADKARSSVQKLVAKFVQQESELLRLAYKLRGCDGRQEIKNEYLNRVLATPEYTADTIWSELSVGDEPADYFDVILLNLPANAKCFDVAESILAWAAAKGWSDAVQAILNDDTKQMLAERKERHEALLKANGVEAVN
jgi:hypothetical protein